MNGDDFKSLLSAYFLSLLVCAGISIAIGSCEREQRTELKP